MASIFAGHRGRIINMREARGAGSVGVVDCCWSSESGRPRQDASERAYTRGIIPDARS